MLDFFAIVIGRWLLGGVGYLIRKLYHKVFPRADRKVQKKSEEISGLEDVLNVEDFYNGLIGAAFVIFIVIITTKC